MAPNVVLQNPSWEPNHVTYMDNFTPESEESKGHFNVEVQASYAQFCCGVIG